MSVLLIIMEMQTKSQWLYYFITVRMGISKRRKQKQTKIHCVLVRIQKEGTPFLHNTVVFSEAARESGVKIKPKIFT